METTLEPVYRNLIYEEENELELLSVEALENAFVGALTAGALNLILPESGVEGNWTIEEDAAFGGRRRRGNAELTDGQTDVDNALKSDIMGRGINNKPRDTQSYNFDKANFAQKTYSSKFSPEGQKFYSELVGKSIIEVNDLADAIKNNVINVRDVPIDFIVRDGHILILNTRSSQALIKAGIPRSKWNFRNRTGNLLYETMLTDQLKNNKLTSAGVAEVRMSGRPQR